MMVGRELGDYFFKQEVERGEVVLEVRGLQAHGSPETVDLTLHAGEIVGLAGLVGAGRSGLLSTLFGLQKKGGGEVLVDGRASPHPPSARRDRGRVRARSRGPEIGRPRVDALRAGEPRHGRELPRLPSLPRRHEAGARAGEGVRRESADPHAFLRHAGARALGRQPAEGRHRQVARPAAEDLVARRADAAGSTSAPSRRSSASWATSPRRARRS